MTEFQELKLKNIFLTLFSFKKSKSNTNLKISKPEILKNNNVIETSETNLSRGNSDTLKKPRSLKRHETCSIDLSDKTLRLQNKSQFRSMESNMHLVRTNSIDFSSEFPLEPMPIDDFEQLEVLGQGAFGRAVKVRHLKTGHYFVLKEVLSHSKEDEDSILREVKLLRNLNHENILICRGLVLKDKRICLLTELMEGGSLQERIQDSSSEINLMQKFNFLRDIASGMDYLHSNSIVHRDLTSSNCLLRKNNCVVVSDFGLSKLLIHQQIFQLSRASMIRPSNYLGVSSQSSESINDHGLDASDYSTTRSNCFLSTENITMNNNHSPVQSSSKSVMRRIASCSNQPELNNDIDTDYQVQRKSTNIRRKHTVVGNPFWMAPEMLAGDSYNSQVDLYSYGIISCEIMARVSAHPDYLDRKHKDMSVDFDLFMNKHRTKHLADCPQPMIDLMRYCCHTDPELRPTFDAILTWMEDAIFCLSNNKPLRSTTHASNVLYPPSNQ